MLALREVQRVDRQLVRPGGDGGKVEVGPVLAVKALRGQVIDRAGAQVGMARLPRDQGRVRPRGQRRVWVRGDRKDYYEANRDVPGIAVNRLKDGLTRRLAGLDSALAEAEEQVEQMSDNPGSRDFYRQRLKELRKHRNSLGKVLGNMDRVYAMVRRLL